MITDERSTSRFGKIQKMNNDLLEEVKKVNENLKHLKHLDIKNNSYKPINYELYLLGIMCLLIANLLI